MKLPDPFHRIQAQACLYGAIAFLLVLAAACAQPLSPTGGPRDEDPPRIVKTEPDSAALNVSTRDVVLYFDEPVRLPVYEKEVLVSPFIKRPKITIADNAKRVKIHFEEDLRPATTYVITLSEIRDQHEGTAIKVPYILAFSTGSTLDSLRIKGLIHSPVLGLDEKEMSVLLFDADSIREGNFLGQRPAYLTKTDASGGFEFRYLRKAPYVILGLKDGDQSVTYSQANEKVAISAQRILDLTLDSLPLSTVELYSFLPDDQSPALRTYAWLGEQTLAIRLSESPDLTPLEVFFTDTLGNDTLKIDTWGYVKDKEPELLLSLPRSNTVGLLTVRNMSDSLGNRRDSVLLVEPQRTRKVEGPLMSRPVLRDLQGEWELLTYRPVEAADEGYFQLSDTARRDSNRLFIPLRFRKEGFKTFIHPDTAINPAAPWLLRVSSAFLPDTSLKDSTFIYPLKWFDKADYGSLAGKILFDSTYRGPTALLLYDSKKNLVASTRDSVFRFAALPADTYTARVILDADSNGVWTPGSLRTGRLPERIFDDPDKITIRAKWDFEDLKVRIRPQAPAAEAPANGKAAPGSAPAPGTRTAPGGTALPGGPGKGG